MKRATKLMIGFAAIAAGGMLSGAVSTHGLGAAFATDAPNAKKAASEAKEARKAIAKRDAGKAVSHAEAAVANDPHNAEYRAMLGQAYMLAGRFASAAQALDDSLSINPENGPAALNLALAKIAQGDWAGARSTLQTHADHIPASDRGLAFALAGDPVTAIDILNPAARAADANAKTRQNLALSLALAGRWAESREIAAMDVAPEALDARIMQWANFSRPKNAYDQVASLLNVTPVQDAGQPAQLALARQNPVAVAAVEAPVAAPVDTYMPGATAEAQPAALAEVAVEPQPEPAQVAGTGPSIVFGPSAEVVQSVPVRRPVVAEGRVSRPAKVVAVAATKPAAVAARAPAKVAKGSYYVQLGAYVNAGVAKDAWGRYARKVPALTASAPQGSKVSTRAGNFYRLSVGGFARADADSLCRQVRSSGGTCFVRVAAGDRVAAWVKPGAPQVASR